MTLFLSKVITTEVVWAATPPLRLTIRAHSRGGTNQFHEGDVHRHAKNDLQSKFS